MVTVIGKIVCMIVVWRPLSFSIVINDEIAGQPHEPVLQVTLFRIVLTQRAINPNKDFLREVFRGVGARSKAVRKIVYTSGVTLDNLLPCRTISSATPANQFGSFVGSQRSCSPHLMSSPALTDAQNLTLSGKVENSLVESGYEGSEAKVPGDEPLVRSECKVPSSGRKLIS
jgi:hypothetical protein